MEYINQAHDPVFMGFLIVAASMAGAILAIGIERLTVKAWAKIKQCWLKQGGTASNEKQT